MIVVARRADDTVACAWHLTRRRLIRRVVRFDLHHVTKTSNTNAQWAWTSTFRFIEIQRHSANGCFVLKFDLSFEVAFGVANEREFDFFAWPTAQRIHGLRSRECTDMQTIMATRIAAVRTFPNANGVRAIGRGKYGHATVLR